MSLDSSSMTWKRTWAKRTGEEETRPYCKYTWNTVKNPGNLRGRDITEISVKNHLSKLMRRNSQRMKIMALLLYSFESFSRQRKLMVSYWGLSDNKSPQVSRTLLSILAELNNAVIWMVSSPCINPLVTVPRSPIVTGIVITFMFHNFLNSQATSRYLSLFSLCGLPGQQSPQFCKFSFLFVHYDKMWSFCCIAMTMTYYTNT